MSLTLDQDVTPSPTPSPAIGTHTPRFVAVRADLMPAEVMAARRADRMRSRVIVALAVVVVLLAGGYVASWWQTHSAQSDLDALRGQSVALEQQTQSYASLVEAQDATASIDAQLQRLMVGDLSWHDLLITLRAKAPVDVNLTQIAGTVTSPAAGTGAGATAAPDPLNESGESEAGSLTLTGTAPDKTAVAAYADKLGHTTGLTAPFVNSVTAGDGVVTFDMTVPITTDALGGRWQEPTTAATPAPDTTEGS